MIKKEERNQEDMYVFKIEFQKEQEIKEGIVIVANKTLYYNLDGQSSTLSMWYGLTLLVAMPTMLKVFKNPPPPYKTSSQLLHSPRSSLLFLLL